jgi:hypothetical protein
MGSTMITKLAVPTIHLNGTSKEVLLEDYCNAIHALHEAGSALAKAYPNARDYYPQGNGAINAAMDQHDDRMNRLRGIIKELEVIAEAVS